MTDKIKIAFAVLALALGIGAFYYFDTQLAIVRVLMVLGGFAVAIAIGYPTDMGRSLWEFLKAARVELRKVVWPTNKETMQMTLVVFTMVVLVALFLWIVDWSLRKIVFALVGTGA
ncbi:MAG: preprotein translocase subunit SecE [Gammaproteobacteria bacterium]|nr:preprotein translocase subunit SecE [Gammaproteobacteria bacterium]